jgi:hypothetical protein
MKITDKVRLFAEGVVSGLSQADAYRRAYNCEKMKDTTIIRRAVDIAADSNVKALIENLRSKVAERVITQAADVTEEMLRIHAVDTTEIVQHRRLNCRYCNGTNHAYQWRDIGEFKHALVAHEAAIAQAGRTKKARDAAAKGGPSDEGGYGFRFNAQPVPSCPNCLGEGITDVFIADTRFLTREQKRVIQSIKQGKEGVEIKFRDQDGALKAAGQMLGGFKSTIVLQNPDGTPVVVAPQLPTDPLAAAQAYAEWIKAASKR